MKRLLCSLALFMVLTTVTQAQSTSCKASMSTYSQLREGMSLSKAQSIIGCAGSELSSSNIAGIRTVMLSWEGRGQLGANMNAMFQNGRLVSKAQFGLR